jgi:excisionase family DNA binding protein
VPLSLKEAAQRVGVNKTTLLRQIKCGRLSASRTETGLWTIDAAELFRVYEPKPRDAAVQESAAPRCVPRDAADHAAAGAPDAAGAAAVELRIAAACLEVENAALKTLVVHLTAERDRWCEQAQRLALTDQTKRGALVTTVPSVALEPSRPWWRRLVRA